MELLKHIFAFDPNSPLLFTQFYFWAFFAIVYAVFSLVESKRLLRNAFLFFVSLFFYYKTSGLALLILLFVTLSDFLIAKRIAKSESLSRRKAWLIFSLTIDLGLLCYFKYAYLLTNMLNDMLASLSACWPMLASLPPLEVFDVFAWIGNGGASSGYFRVDQIVLPVGISFYIFQVISYTMDVYRREIKPVSNILDFGFYVSFFPQLVAGPIVRASEFVPQLYKPYHLGRRQFGLAIFWILNGLIKKIVLSDYLAVNFVDRVFDNPLLFSGFENLSALFLYSLQVYADFSGYTDIAIGVAMLMGFYLPQNFNSPYKAPNPHNFWKRWHMSLSRWLQSYLYIPLGGNRSIGFGTYFWILTISLIVLILTGSFWVSGILLVIALLVILVKPATKRKLYAHLNSFITMLLGGIWHGASWNFMLWGGLNGIGMIVYKLWKDMSWWLRILLLFVLWLSLCILRIALPMPIWNVFFVWLTIVFAVSCVRALYAAMNNMVNLGKVVSTIAGGLSVAWAVAQTFTFITFTRLFFRSGSNLDPATANKQAWETATNMINQIGGAWDVSLIPQVLLQYGNVFILFFVGMLIHWLPSKFKQWYRLNFALLPLPVILILIVFVVCLVYQFITADLQPFIYFQF